MNRKTCPTTLNLCFTLVIWLDLSSLGSLQTSESKVIFFLSLKKKKYIYIYIFYSFIYLPSYLFILKIFIHLSI